MFETCLLIAHPGHELRVFGWMEECRPLVCILTDGSGNTGESRMVYSRNVIGAAGAEIGPVMGSYSDRDWYSAILSADSRPFVAAASAIAGSLAPGCLVVSDPVEGYNPMHDLCSAVADMVAAQVGGIRASYALMGPLAAGAIRRLAPDVAFRKRCAVEGYAPLRVEGDALLRRHPEALVEEQISGGSFDWPERLVEAPAYEATGRTRTEDGVYHRPITYAAHVRPMAIRLRQAVLAQASS